MLTNLSKEYVIPIFFTAIIGAQNIYFHIKIKKCIESINYLVTRNLIEIDNLWEYVNAALNPELIDEETRQEMSFIISMNHYLTKEDREYFENTIRGYK